MTREITYSQALYEGFNQLLERDDDVFVIGQGLWSPWYVGSTMNDFEKKFGKDRIMDSPVSENATTGMAIGAAMLGKRPIIVHPRMDFMLLAMDPIINQASNWSYLFQGQANVPMVIRSIINRGGEQGAQHSQALQSFFMHVPGIKVVMPSTPADAKGLLASAVYDGNPIMFIDDRWCYDSRGPVPEKLERIPLGEGEILSEGDDVTIVANSYLVHESIKAVEMLNKMNISAEIINLRTVKPWDLDLVSRSVSKTKKLIVVDSGWIEGGIAAEISSKISGLFFNILEQPVLRIGLPNSPAPCSRTLEEIFYPNDSTIVAAVKILFGNQKIEQLDFPSKTIPGYISF